MAHPFVPVRTDIIIVRKILFFREVAENLNVAVGVHILRKDVMIGNDYQLFLIPHFRLRSELPFEDSERTRTAHIVRHQHIHIDPDIVAGGNGGSSRMFGENLFRDGHRHTLFRSIVLLNAGIPLLQDE